MTSKKLFFLLVFLLPISTGKVFFSEQSFFYGYHIFYHSFWVFLTDIVFCGLMLAWLWETLTPTSSPPHEGEKIEGVPHQITSAFLKDRVYQGLLFFWLILAISTILSREMLLSWYGLARFTEYFFVFIYIRENFHISREMKSFFWLILAISLLETGLGIAQYVNQSSLGLKYLGESLLKPGMPGVAEFISHGIGSWQNISHEMLVMRAYGTLPHPNILGVFLFTGLLANIWLIYGTLKGFRSWEISLFPALILVSTGMVLTFSRAVWIVIALVLLSLLVMLRIRKYRVFETMRSGRRMAEQQGIYLPKHIAALILALLVALGLNFFLFGEQIKDRIVGRGVAAIAEQESFVDRQHFNSISREMIKTHPLLGVGLRNFVARMDEFNRPARHASQGDAGGGERLFPQQHQPVHNIYFLVAAETGLAGLAALLFLLYNIVRHAIQKIRAGDRGERTILLVLFFGFLCLGLVDHYFVSIQPSAMLFWIVAGLVSAKSV